MLEDQPPNANSGVCFRAAFCGKRGAKTFPISKVSMDNVYSTGTKVCEQMRGVAVAEVMLAFKIPKSCLIVIIETFSLRTSF